MKHVNHILWIAFGILFFLGLGSLQAGEYQRLLDLSGKWRFTIGDRAAWASPRFDDRDWELIHVPSPWEDQGFHGYNGYAWYRKSFRLPQSTPDGELYLFLGYIDDADEVYVNGQLVGFSGTFPPRHITAWRSFRKYPIPRSLLRSGEENVIAVRVYDSQIAGGIVEGEVGLFLKRGTFTLDINLAGVWNFRAGDRLEWRYLTEADATWSKIMVPGHWEHQGFKNHDGYAWYQKTFCPPIDLASRDLVLLLGKIDDTDQVFINGKLVGATGLGDDGPYKRNDTESWQKFRVYRIPAYTLLVNDDNVITVRVHDWINNGGIYQGPIGILRAERFSMRDLYRWEE